MTIDELKSYRYIKQEIEHIRRQIAEADKDMCYLQSVIINDMPKGSMAVNSLERAIEKKDRLSMLYLEKINQLSALQFKIEYAISQLSPVEREVIRLRYIDCMRFEKIAIKTNYAIRNIFYIHSKAVEKLKRLQ